MAYSLLSLSRYLVGVSSGGDSGMVLMIKNQNTLFSS